MSDFGQFSSDFFINITMNKPMLKTGLSYAFMQWFNLLLCMLQCIDWLFFL